jgi:VWFA-related protein
MRILVLLATLALTLGPGRSKLERPYDRPERRYDGPGQQQAPTFRARADAVVVDVSVRESARVITNLTAADFEVLDNGVPQQVTDVSFGKVPIDVTIILDVSQSVSGPTLERLRRGVLQLMRDLNKEDRLKLMTFNMRVSRIVDFTPDPAEFERALKTALSGGGSSVWDAIAVALVSASEPNRRQLVVLFSDAADTSSTLDSGTLISVAQRTTASFSAVVAAQGSPGRAGMFMTPGASVLQRLTIETGGGLFPIGATNPDLTAAFRRAVDQFRSSYVLHFTPAGVERTGFHTLKVTVKGKPKATITARRGYFWQ